MGILEESGAVVENEVNAGKLLPRLEEDAGESAEENAVAAIAEAIGVGGLTDLFFVLKVEANLVEISLDARVSDVGAGETRQCLGGSGIIAPLDQVSWGLEA
jgi:hypothetical protein